MYAKRTLCLCWLIPTIDLTLPGITWEERLKEGLLRLGCHVRVVYGGIPLFLTDLGTLSPLKAVPCHGPGLDCLRDEKPSWAMRKPASKQRPCLFSLSSWLRMWCDHLPEFQQLLLSDRLWHGIINWIKPLLSYISFGLGICHNNRNATRTPP